MSTRNVGENAALAYLANKEFIRRQSRKRLTDNMYAVTMIVLFGVCMLAIVLI